MVEHATGGLVLLIQLLVRFVVGGLFVSAFAVLGTILKPKSFAGLFGAAPSVALASLILTARTEGQAYSAHESRSMLAGAIAFLTYAWTAMFLMHRYNWSVKLVTSLLLVEWLAVALTIWFVFLRTSV
jgi:Protein of unknown function (DUF3147)